MARQVKLTAKQEAFVREYLVDLNATQAAIRAGYKAVNAHTVASQNLAKPYVAERIQELMDERSKKTEITAERVLEELAKMAFANIANIYDDQGRLLPVKEMPEDVAACLQEVTEGVDRNGDVQRKYKMADKKSTLELLGKHLKLFTDKTEVTGKDGEQLMPTTVQLVAPKGSGSK
jgi:phage terminase small subunit